ncbi:hypothetical protein LAD12857_20250 [Lacrimispora amygdalina]|uniref:ATP-binding protein n=1 Tax=Lacrimispora amygdalina TaxID=253257 RepID=A0ABQ5M5L0_9FIRM
MTLESILSGLKVCNAVELSDNAHESITKINKEVFYVQPKYEQISVDQKARFMLFSAPGASGKSALAEHIAHKYHGLYWNLAKIRLGENSFHGTLWRAMEQDKLLNFFSNLNTGNGVLVLDAFDEAELISGRAGVEYLLNDVNEVTKDSTVATVLLFARTESAVFIAEYCKKNQIKYAQYEIGFFEEYNAKEFIKKKIVANPKNNRINMGQTVDACINEQFATIRRLIGNDEAAKSFIGYAPVLEALAGAFDEEKNTMKLLGNIKDGNISGTNIIYKILEELLGREQEKVVKALKEKWSIRYPNFMEWDNIFTIEEQAIRIVEYILFDEIAVNSFYVGVDFPDELHLEYIDSLKNFLPQHPFLQNLIKNTKNEFTGPAFRDYVLAYILSTTDYLDLALEYFADRSQTSHFPSQLLFDFYSVFSKGETTGKIFPLLYDSYKAKESAGRTAMIEISGNDTEKFIVFSLYDGSSEGNIEENELHVDEKEPFYISRLSNSSVDIDGTVYIGEPSGMTRIYNSSIICENMVFNSSNIFIESCEPGYCLLASRNNVVNKLSELPKFEITTDDKSLVKIAIPNIHCYYRLRPYKYELEDESGDEFFKFTLIVSKIMSCLRKHRKDVPAKDREFIDNEIISKSTLKRSVLDFLIKKGIIFIDSRQSYLYKLDVDKLAEYDLNWVVLGQKEIRRFQFLYNEFKKSFDK